MLDTFIQPRPQLNAPSELDPELAELHQPERVLLRRLLFRAVLDLVSPDPETRRAARFYFNRKPHQLLDNPEKSLCFTFQFCCEMLDIDPVRFLARLRARGLQV